MKNIHTEEPRDLLVVVKAFQSALGNENLRIEDFQESRAGSFVTYLTLNGFKVKIISNRGCVECRIGPPSAVNQIDDKVDGSRIWFFPEEVRDFVRGRLPVSEDEIFKRSDPLSIRESVLGFAETISEVIHGVRELFVERDFQEVQRELEEYGRQRAEQIAEISKRRFGA